MPGVRVIQRDCILELLPVSGRFLLSLALLVGHRGLQGLLVAWLGRRLWSYSQLNLLVI